MVSSRPVVNCVRRCKVTLVTNDMLLRRTVTSPEGNVAIAILVYIEQLTHRMIGRTPGQTDRTGSITRATTGIFEQLICLQGYGTLHIEYQLSRLLFLEAAALACQSHFRIMHPLAINVLPHHPPSGVSGALQGELTRNCFPTMGHLTIVQ